MQKLKNKNLLKWYFGLIIILSVILIIYIDSQELGFMNNFFSNFNKSFFLTQTFWTFMVFIAAVITPWIVNWLNNRPKNSNLVWKNVSVIHQDSDPDNSHMAKLYDVGRIVLKNNGKFIAKSVEAYIEKIIWDEEERKDFIPMPLIWTHGELNAKGLTVRDIYPNQTVYLDIFNHIFDPDYTGESSVIFSIATGTNYEDLSKLNIGKSELLIRLYQESGQINKVWLNVIWDGKSVPKIFIIKKLIK